MEIVLPLCSTEVDVGHGETDVRCPFTTFKTLIGKSLKHECVADTLRPFVDSLGSKDHKISDASGINRPATTAIAHDAATAASFSLVMWVLFSALIVAFITMLGRHFLHQQRVRTDAHRLQKEYETLERSGSPHKQPREMA